MNLAQLEAEVFSLPLQDRAALAQRLLLSREEVSDSEFEQLWGEESVRRLAEYDAGKVQSVPASAVAEKARALLR